VGGKNPSRDILINRLFQKPTRSGQQYEDIPTSDYVALYRQPVELRPGPDDDIPNPEIDFEACVEAVTKRTERMVKSLSKAERRAYFLERACSGKEWCRRIKAPAQFSGRVEKWLERLERRWPS